MAVVTIDSRELAQLQALARQACTDDLTGVLGRRGLTYAWRALTTPPACLCLLDLDGFKAVNDTHGHAAGDQVLVTVARRIQQCADLVARLGGDEYVALIPNAGAAYRIAALVADPIDLGNGETVQVTASIGVVTHPTGDLGEDLRRVDQAMYWAKATSPGGVSQVRVWTRDLGTLPTRRQRVCLDKTAVAA